jgi:hypothetical protein
VLPGGSPHQGGLVDLPSGETWFIGFQSTGRLGRAAISCRCAGARTTVPAAHPRAPGETSADRPRRVGLRAPASGLVQGRAGRRGIPPAATSPGSMPAATPSRSTSPRRGRATTRRSRSP